MKYIIYKVTCTINGMIYIGYHSTDDINDNYGLNHEIMFDNIPLKYVNAIFYFSEFTSHDKLKLLFPNIKLVPYPLIDKTNSDGTISKTPDISIIFNYKKFLEPYSY